MRAVDNAVDNFELIRRFMHFESTDQFYFMQILQRKKDGPGPNGIVCGTNNKARAIKNYCITSVEMLDRISIEVKHLCEYFNARAYFYPSRRSFRQVAMRNMVLLANNISESNYGHVKTDYWSACGTTEIEKFYLVDVDNDKCDKEQMININVEIEENVRSGAPVGQRIKLCVPTKNGIHFICAPFDVASFKEKYPDIDVHKSNPTILYCLKD